MTHRHRWSPSRFLVTSIAASSTLALVLACSADGGGDGIFDGNEASAGDGAPAKLPPPSGEDSGRPKDGGKDAAKDAKDAGFDAGKPAPNTGDPCTTLDEIFKRTCGVCGTQEALCAAKEDGTLAISDYSSCVNELSNGCLPGTVETSPCGNCGTLKRTCTASCAWNTGACMGEPVNSCTPTAQDSTAAGCPGGGAHTRSCGDTCSWTNYSAACEPGFTMVVAAAPGDTVSAIYSLKAAVAGKRMLGVCGSNLFSSTTTHPYVYVELVNPTEGTLTLSAWNTAATSSSKILNTVMAWYAGTARPTDDATRKTCTKGVVDPCPAGLPCGDTKWAGVTGNDSVVIPPFGTATLFFGSYYQMGLGAASPCEGDVKLVVRTDSTQ